MREVIKKVYYCEYCNKHYLSKYWAEIHEKRCTLNPNRTCGLHGYIKSPPPKITKILDTFSELDYLPSVEEIKDKVDNCPICILTVMRCIIKDKRFQHKKGIEDGFFNWNWDYTEAIRKFWKEENNKEGYY